MKILLTGATGFIGSYILEGLLEEGHSICIVKRSSSKTDRIDKFLKKCSVYDWDKTTIEKICAESHVECIIHCATYYGRNDRECIMNIESNLLFPLELLNIGIKCGVKVFINTDSFFCNQIQKESDLDKEFYMSGYTLSKTQFRQWGRMFAARYGIRFINMKLEHVYGEKDADDKFIPYIVKQCKENIPVLKLSEGTQERDFVYVLDVVNAYKTVINSLKCQKSYGYIEYDVGTGRSWRLREFVEIIHKAVKSTTILEWGAVKMKNGEIMSSKANNIGLKSLGWVPDVVENEKIEQVFRTWGGVFLNFITLCNGLHGKKKIIQKASFALWGYRG